MADDREMQMLTFILLGEGTSNMFAFELNYDLKLKWYVKEQIYEHNHAIFQSDTLYSFSFFFKLCTWDFLLM